MDTVRCGCGIILFTGGQRRAAFKTTPKGVSLCLKCADKLTVEVKKMRPKLADCSAKVAVDAEEATRRLTEAMRELELGDVDGARERAAAARGALERAETAVGAALAR